MLSYGRIMFFFSQTAATFLCVSGIRDQMKNGAKMDAVIVCYSKYFMQ
ncbi:hypothetical protein LSH36_451g02004 [Paralvinella palmiformis]|uniref:Uncharacterized protein n=1 Tax=Paralvinella palmiformis TaxID=53620 RepID=A0AAD9JB03_9ANNE|nr:hypothetical protein LSH36_451g02004 [Paralvinella palmiformis]